MGEADATRIKLSSALNKVPDLPWLQGHVQLCAALSELNFSGSVEWAAPPSCPPAQRAEQLASFWRDRLGGRRQGGSDSGDEE